MKTPSTFRRFDLSSPHSTAKLVRSAIFPNRKPRHWFCVAALVAALGAAATAQVPQLINYQGRVAVNGVNFDGTGSFKFALVDAGTNTAQTATATAVLTGGFVTSVTVTLGGSGYTSPPAVSFSGGGGSGAAATATITAGAVTTITMTNAGAGYASPPAVSIGSPEPNIVHVTYWSNDGTGTAGSEPTNAVALAVTKGLYSVLLGDATRPNMTPVPVGVFTNPDVCLRVWFNNGINGSQLLTPDQRIAAVGYAMMAGGLAPGATIPASAVITAPPGMLLIPAGAFTMGNTVAADTDITNASPVTVTLSAFYLAANEVTLSQWQAVYLWAASNGYSFTHPGLGKSVNHPVHTVNWYDVVKWCNARSQMEGLTPVYYTDTSQTTIYQTGEVDITHAMVKWTADGYRLPTEAEWEKAARGGLAGQRFPWGNTITQNLANYIGSTYYAYDLGPNGYNTLGNDGTGPYTTPVGTFAANGYGLHDMAGNVWEWCWDWYGTPYAGGGDPRGPVSGLDRVYRGGGWSNSADYARCSGRSRSSTAYSYDFMGFRLARSSVP